MRKYLLIASFALLLLMIFFYLIGQLDTSNWLGSLGFALLIVTIVSYLPQLFKRGYIDKY